MSNYQDELKTAIHAVNEAQSVINRFFEAGFDIRTKSDNSPVTDADVEAERTIKSILLDAFPDYGFYGEETDREGLDAEFLWLVDPIDGTKSFVRRSPFFSTQIALMHQGKIVVGVSNAPAMNQMACAVAGQGAILDGESVACRQTTELTDAYFSAGNIGSLAKDPELWMRYARLVSSVARVRGYGDFYHYHQLCCGQADLIIESDVNILDIAALSLIVEEAGGVFTDLSGGSIDLETTSVLAAATTLLHAQARAMFPN